jgi:hypothetical protein
MHLGSTRTTPLIVIVALGLVCLCDYFARVLHESVFPRPVRWPVEPGDIALANSFSEASGEPWVRSRQSIWERNSSHPGRYEISRHKR